MNQLRLTVIGRHGVGKTTLITSMYDQTVQCLKGTGINLYAQLATSTALANHLKELRCLAKETIVVVNGDGMDGTAERKKYAFELGSGKNNQVHLRINFTDFPGGWLEDRKKEKEVVQIGSQADVILLPIDSPSLVEKNGKYHETINMPNQIHLLANQIESSARDDRPRLVVLAPIRCEKYVASGQDPQKLTQRVREAYAATIHVFDERKTAVVITPIQTIGCLQFCGFLIGKDKNDRSPKMKFSKKKANDVYSPVDCDQPMRYLLRFILRQHHQVQQGTWWNRLTLGLFADQEYLRAAQEIAKGCKDRLDGFEIVQGHHLL